MNIDLNQRRLFGPPDIYFRIARVCLLLLILVLPMAHVTALREIFSIGLILSLGVYLWTDPERRLSKTALCLPWLLYILICLLSLFSAVDWEYSLKEFRAEVIKGALLYYAGAHFVQTRENLKQAWLTLLAGAGLMSVMGLFMFWFHLPDPAETFLRAQSLHYGYGAFATYVVMVWPFVLLSPLAWEGRRWKWLGGLLILLTAGVGYLTFSRAAWLAMLVTLILGLILLSRRRLRQTGLALAICVSLVFGLWLVPGAHHGENWKLLLQSPTAMGGTAGDLFTLWHFSAREIEKSPFAGIGLGRHSFSQAFPEFRLQHQPLLWHAHNMFLELALQLGVQGLLIILWMMGTLVFLLTPRRPPVSGDYPPLFALATVMMVVSFAVRNFFDDFFVDDSSLMFWLIAGLAMGSRELFQLRPADGRLKKG